MELSAAQFYISPSGLSTNNGSVFQPWDLQTALNQPVVVLPGDTLWLREGSYVGYFTSNLNGSAGNYIYVMNYPGERAIIADNRQYASGATLQVNGSWTVYKGLEITNTNPDRSSAGSASFRPMGIQAEGSNTKFINLIIHDTGHGFGFWNGATDSEIYGCLIYNCGTDNSPGTYSTHGHAIYSQNDAGIKTIENNFLFNQFGFGLHLYPNPGQVNNYLIRKNTIFHNGILTDDTNRYNNILVNPYPPYTSQAIELVGNRTYDAGVTFTHSTLYDADIFVGAVDVDCGDIILTENYFAGQARAGLAILNWQQVDFSNNTCYYLEHGILGAALPSGTVNGDYSWDNNAYYGGGYTNQFSYEGGVSTNFSSWQSTTGFDNLSTFSNAEPTGVEIFLEPNIYDPGRAHLTIYNWDETPTVSVDLSSLGMIDGTTFYVVDAQNYFGSPVYSGTYSTINPSVDVPMNLTETQVPFGMSALAHTPGEFGTFVIMTDFAPLGVNELNAVNDPVVYPNPAKSEFYLSGLPIGSDGVKVELYSLNGTLIYEEYVFGAEHKLEVQGLSSGCYLLNIITNDHRYQNRLILE